MNIPTNISPTVDTRVLEIAQQLEPETDVDTALRQLLINEVRRRLAAYELMVRNFQHKYQMTLAEFEASDMVEQQGYSFEVENDHQDWDQAIDALPSLRALLRELTSSEDKT
jgi:LPS O-antigen subunit length determinant protein (WzzB/FepE family)